MEASTRSRRRRNVVGTSPHRDVYVRLMKADWTSEALERYAWHRFREDIPASTFRHYRNTKHITPDSEDVMFEPPSKELMDVLGERARLIEMQKSRVAIDYTHERSMAKLFTGNKDEIRLLNELMSAYKGDLQDLGLFPKSGETLTVKQDKEDPKDIPARRGTLEELAQGDPVAAAELAKVIHLAQTRANGASAAG